MVTGIRGEGEISVGGQMLPLRFTFERLAWLEEQFSARDMNDVISGSRFSSVASVRTMYLAGRQGADRKVTPKQALEEFESIELPFPDAAQVIFKAMANALGLDTDDKEDDAAKKKDEGESGTGENS
jgi:hypothetical protein